MAEIPLVIGGSSLHTPVLFAAMADSLLELGEVRLVRRSLQSTGTVGRYCRLVAEEIDLPVRVTWETTWPGRLRQSEPRTKCCEWLVSRRR